jgi:outer membrane protein assembly factor BamA
VLLLEIGCTARRVPAGQKMVKKVVIVCRNNDIDKGDMYSYVKQKPNRKLLGINVNSLFRWHIVRDSVDSTHVRKRLRRMEKGYYKTGAGIPLYLMIHNIVNPERAAKREARRKLKGKDKKKDGTPRKNIDTLLRGIGEPPVILDTTSMRRSSQQLELYLDNKGYFRSEVTDSIGYPSLFRHHFLKKTPDSLGIFGRRKKKAIVYYIVKPANLYTIDTIRWSVEDPNMAYDVFSDTASKDMMIHTGDPYDLDRFEAERDRLVLSLRNNGYYTFSRDFIRFKADTTVGNHKVNIIIRVLPRQLPIKDCYFVRNIYVKTIYSTSQLKNDTVTYDSIVSPDHPGVTFLRNVEREPELRFKTDVIYERIMFRTGGLYKLAQFEETYNQLTSLRVFRQVVLEPSAAPGTDQLDVHLMLFAIPKQNFTAQVEGTNTGGYLGVGGSFAYQNNNLARGAELFEFRIKGGTEAQQPLAQTGQSTAADQLTFNTIELGAEISLNIPRAYGPFKYLPLKTKSMLRTPPEARRTTFSTSVNYQRRVDFDRLLMNVSIGYTYRVGKYQRIGIYPFEVNVVKVNPRQGLLDLLANGDVLLQYRFTDHLINNFRFTFEHNESRNQRLIEQRKWIPVLKFNAEVSGFAPYYVMKAINAPKDDLGSYRIGGIPFSHYIRLFVDGRLYKDFGDHQRIVMRMAIGAGFPQKNFRTLPLEKSFYGGGVNGIRAWEARSLGPGSLNVPADQQFAQFGEVQIEYNIELRFRITKSLFGALFADGGNIWLLPSAAADEAAEFGFNDFYKDFAFGPGFGIRYDLSFFIVRLDWGFKMRDPSKPYGDRWWEFGDGYMPSNLNFGIGYPF